MKLTLPTQAEASLHLQHADCELTIAWNSKKWNVHIIDTSGIAADCISASYTLSCEEVAALLFLWGAADELSDGPNQAMVDMCYGILAHFLSSLPQNLRPIP